MASKATKAAKAATSTPKPEDVILEAVQALRANPKKYQALRKAMAKARTDEAKVKTLIKYATSDRQLAALIPARAGGTQVAWTTVTVTTVIVLVDTAY